jgi:large conductance mechanosensitive channel
MFKEFKEFAVKGNVIDLAVGIIIGAAFNGVVTSLVNDVIMAPLGYFTHKVNFTNMYINLSSSKYPSLAAARAADAPVVAYGSFLNSLINFLIVAFAVFLLVRWINRFRRGEEKDPTEKECPYCISQIPIKAVKCSHCTADLVTGSVRPA